MSISLLQMGRHEYMSQALRSWGKEMKAWDLFMRVAAADGRGREGGWHQTLDTPACSLQPTLDSCVLCGTGYAMVVVVVAIAGCLHGVRAVLIVFKARVNKWWGVSIPRIRGTNDR